MLKRTEDISLDGHTYLKCKTCKQEFYVVSSAYYAKTICFCPYCGDYANKLNKLRYHGESETEEEYE